MIIVIMRTNARLGKYICDLALFPSLYVSRALVEVTQVCIILKKSRILGFSSIFCTSYLTKYDEDNYIWRKRKKNIDLYAVLYSTSTSTLTSTHFKQFIKGIYGYDQPAKAPEYFPRRSLAIDCAEKYKTSRKKTFSQIGKYMSLFELYQTFRKPKLKQGNV